MQDHKKTTKHTVQTQKYWKPIDFAYDKACHETAMNHDHFDFAGNHPFCN